MIGALVRALLVAAAVWAAWPGAASERWGVFQAPEIVQVVHLGDTAVAANVQSGGGRVRAAAPVELVFRRATEQRQIDAVDPQGQLRLFLGDEGPTLALTREGLLLEPTDRTPVPVAAGATIALRCADGRATALVDGEVVSEAAWTAPAPSGRCGVRLAGDASFVSLMLHDARGVEELATPAVSAEGWGRTLWAGLAALLVVVAVSFWWRERRAECCTWAALGWGILAVFALAGGLSFTLHERNAVRFGTIHEGRYGPLVRREEPTLIEPGRPLELGPGPYAGAELGATIVLTPGAVLDVLVRAAPADMDRQILVTLSADPRLPCGITENLGTSIETELAPQAQRTLPAGVPIRVHVRMLEEAVHVNVDGTLWERFEDLDLRVGRVALHALAGSATVDSLTLSSLSGSLDLTELLWRTVALVGAGVLLSAFLLSLGGSTRAAGLLALAPLAAVVWPLSPHWLALGGGIATALLLLLTPGRRLILVPSTAAVLALSWWALTFRPVEISPTILNQMDIADISGPAIPAEYVWARHPLVRRFNPWVRTQEFRNGAVECPKPEGRQRVVALGSSSTYGYGVGAGQTWPVFLQERLGVEVVNAGIPGATAERLRFVLLGVVLSLEPDLVVVDLGFNDHVQGGAADERAHFAAMTTTGITWWGRLWSRLASLPRQRAWSAYFRALQRGETPDPDDEVRFGAEPAARFADSLRDIALACREAGAEVLFVAEPMRPGEDDPTLAPYHAAMRALGEELGVGVVEPQDALDAAGPEAFVDVVHPKAAGHRILAAEIARVIGEHALLRR